MSRVFSIRVSDRLFADIRDHARMRGIKPAEAVRDLLRRALQLKSSYESGYEEGKIEGHAEYMRQLHGADK